MAIVYWSSVPGQQMGQEPGEAEQSAGIVNTVKVSDFVDSVNEIPI